MLLPGAKNAHVCILAPNGDAVGGGVLVSPQHIVTCAHVAALAWENCAKSIDRPLQEPIKIKFPWHPQREPVTGTAIPESWQAYVEGATDGDLAIIRLSDVVPEGAAQLVQSCENLSDRALSVWGHHSDNEVGSLIRVRFTSDLPTKWLQLGSINSQDYFVKEGASGCGIFYGNSLVGIVAAYDADPGLREAYGISAELIREALLKLSVEPIEAPHFTKISLEIDKLVVEFAEDLPLKSDAAAEWLEAILKLAQAHRRNVDRLRRLRLLADCIASHCCGAPEIERIRKNLADGELLVPLDTDLFSGAEMRMAAADDRPIHLNGEGEADPFGFYNISTPPDCGIDSGLEGDDANGLLGADLDLVLNDKMKRPFRKKADTKERRNALKSKVIDTLRRSCEDGGARYYYTCDEDDANKGRVAQKIQERFGGMVPCLEILITSQCKDDEIIYRLLKIYKICDEAGS